MPPAGSRDEAPDLAEAKRRLREEMRARRDELAEDERALRSQRVLERVVGTPEWADAGTVGFYVSVGSEVDTRSALAAAVGSKRVVAPATDVGAHRLRMREVTDADALVPGPFDVPEPRGPEVVPGELDLVLVPGLAFDAAGRRLGYGQGYYDGFLPTVDAPAVGLAFGFQLVDAVPAGPDDARVDAVATERRVVQARAP